ncbi:MAG: Na/Pi cotransporter family protein [Acholeplasmatales bacterium]|nr:Na/Pi cotransporter family protein [Acholeplasmatales bacterium]
MFLDITLGFDSLWQAILYVLCGLGIFLFGINLMGSSLKEIGGSRMKVIIQKSTSTPLKGMLVGFVVTMLTQSASGTSALAVSLVAAGLMNFGQAFGILLGANIGGTILTIIMAVFAQFKIMPIVSVVLVFLGATMLFLFKRPKIKQIGSVVLGFGMIFLGLALIDMSFKYIQVEHQEFIQNVFAKLDDMPEVGVLVGILVTCVLQSSSATIGIVQGMYMGGTMSLYGALALMLGANVGTTITAILASLGSSRSAKKVALANTLIKVFGVVIFTIIYRFAFYPLVNVINEAVFGSSANPLIISLTHLVFNLINSFVLLMLIKPSLRIMDKLVPENKDDDIMEQLLDYSLIQKSPQLALSFVKKAVDYMGLLTKEFVYLAYNYSKNPDPKMKEHGIEIERKINCLDKRSHDYLIKLTIKSLDSKSSTLLSKYLDLIKDLERVGDHCTNLIEFFEEREEKNMHLSADGAQDLNQMFETVIKMAEGTYDSLINWSSDTATETLPIEDEVDRMEEVFHERHIHRVETGACSFVNTEYFVEILSNLERMGDHFTNVLEEISTVEYCKYDEFHH